MLDTANAQANILLSTKMVVAQALWVFSFYMSTKKRTEKEMIVQYIDKGYLETSTSGIS